MAIRESFCIYVLQLNGTLRLEKTEDNQEPNEFSLNQFSIQPQPKQENFRLLTEKCVKMYFTKPPFLNTSRTYQQAQIVCCQFDKDNHSIAMTSMNMLEARIFPQNPYLLKKIAIEISFFVKNITYRSVIYMYIYNHCPG